ncbi:hypothetical protein F7725_021150 [Dissostichus mawsoni]|uniref:Uncharacterized protein n=1 Tax=Dissostichus mawsoni TaxID=36200 RepID=A0A7J5YF74_DISMA|nr:hypothetical protein F7725_021150 [Dissostichus mawsoni]
MISPSLWLVFRLVCHLVVFSLYCICTFILESLTEGHRLMSDIKRYYRSQRMSSTTSLQYANGGNLQEKHKLTFRDAQIDRGNKLLFRITQSPNQTRVVSCVVDADVLQDNRTITFPLQKTMELWIMEGSNQLVISEVQDNVVIESSRRSHDHMEVNHMPPACFCLYQHGCSEECVSPLQRYCISVIVSGRVKGFRKFSEGQDPECITGGVCEELWFTQKLDHFNGADSRQWKQGPANPAWMQNGTWLKYAEKLGALCFMLEHRFYGKSRPTSSRQALADLAHFLSITAETRGLGDRKWVAFGGSYPGSLAAWIRLKYPHLIHGSVATSAPVHATVNFPEYLEVVRRSLASENADCPKIVEEASNTLIQTEMDSAYFLETLAGNFMDVVQYNEDNRGFEAMSDSLLGDPYQRYAALARFMMETFSVKCLDVSFNSYLKEMTNASWEGPAAGGGRQWVYQTCTEFGFYQSTDSPDQPFSGFPLKYHVQQCADFFNVSADQLAEAVAETNEYYGGYNIRSSRIVLPNGSIDPWHALGVTQDISPTCLLCSSKEQPTVPTCTRRAARISPSWLWPATTSSCSCRSG